MLLLGSASLPRAEQGTAVSNYHFTSQQSMTKSTPEGLVSSALENYESLQSYQCRLTLHATKGEEVQDSEYLFYYQKPNLVRMHVSEGSGKGNTVVLRKDGLIRGRREGALSVFPITLKPDDERLRDLWDRRFAESDWGKILEETLARMKMSDADTMEAVGGGQFLLTIRGDDGFLEQTWLERDQLTLARKHVRLHNGDRLDVRWTDVVLNPQFDEDFFYF